LFGVCAGRIDMAADLVPVIQTEFRALGLRTHGALMGALNKAAHGHRTQHFQWDVLPNFSPIPGAVAPDQIPHIMEAWQQYETGAQIIIGTIDEHGQALMYLMARLEGQEGFVHLW